MKEHLQKLRDWTKDGDEVIIARVTKTWGSSPRPIGSMMIINNDGKMVGSVSGGCVEGAVVKQSHELLKGLDSLKLDYGVSDEEAWSVGLSCGGNIQVYIQKADFKNSEAWSELLKNQEENRSSILISSLEDGGHRNSLIDENGKLYGENIPEELIKEARSAYDQRTNKISTFGDKDYFIQVFPRKSLLLIIGAAHITVDLVSLGNQFGFETIVIDPRGFFTKNTIFTNLPSRLIEAYPSEVLDQFPIDTNTYSAILSHDPKIDDNALEILLPSDVGYIGALGSKKTHTNRVNRLLEKGIDQSLIDKIHAPIGVAINAKSAREIALSIISEIIQEKNRYIIR